MVGTIDQITNRTAPDRGQNRARSLEFLPKRRVCRFDSSIRFSSAGYPASPVQMVSGFPMIAHPPVVNHRLRGFIEPSGGFPETEDFCGRKRFSAIDARISKRFENLLCHKDCDFLLCKSKHPACFLGIEPGVENSRFAESNLWAKRVSQSLQRIEICLDTIIRLWRWTRSEK